VSPWFAAAAATVGAVVLWHIVHTINELFESIDVRTESLDRWERDLNRRETEAAKWFDQ